MIFKIVSSLFSCCWETARLTCWDPICLSVFGGLPDDTTAIHTGMSVCTWEHIRNLHGGWLARVPCHNNSGFLFSLLALLATWPSCGTAFFWFGVNMACPGEVEDVIPALTGVVTIPALTGIVTIPALPGVVTVRHGFSSVVAATALPGVVVMTTAEHLMGVVELSLTFGFCGVE